LNADMKKLISSIATEFSSMKRWNWLQWLLFAAIMAIIAVMIIPNWAYPQGWWFMGEEGELYYDPRLANPNNPKWVNFIQDNDGLPLVAMFVCIGSGAWIIRISGKRHDELLSDAYAELATCDQEEDFVGWYYVWRKEGLSDDDLINCFIGKPVPLELKRELERQGKRIIFAKWNS